MHLVGQEVLLQIQECLFLLGIPVVHIAQGRIGNGETVIGVDGIQGLLPTGLQFLIGADDKALIVHHGVIAAGEKQILQPVRAAGGPVYAGEQLGDLFRETGSLEALRCDHIWIAQQGIEKADVGAAPGVGLGGGGHAEVQLPRLDGGEQVADRHFRAYKAQLLRQALADAKDHRGNGDGLGMFDTVLGVPGGEPQAAGRPHRIIVHRFPLEGPHDIQGALVLHLDVHAPFPGEVIQDALQLLVLRAGEDAQRHISAVVESLLSTGGIAGGGGAVRRCRATGCQKQCKCQDTCG